MNHPPKSVCIFAASGTSMLTLASVMDPLRAANRLSRSSVFDWRIVSPNGKAITLSNDVSIKVDGSILDTLKGDIFIAVAGFNQQREVPKSLLAQVRRVANRFDIIFSVEAGAWLLARAGVIHKNTVTTHWEDLENFAFAFPHLNVVNQRFVVDGKVWSSGGASPTLDMLLHYLRVSQRPSLALDVANAFIYSESVGNDENAVAPSMSWLDRVEPRLAKALKIMDTHHEQPLSINEVSARLHMSTRTLEILMQRHLGTSPGAYYLRSRLQAARRLVLDTRSSMLEIAVRTGFGSPSAFARAFKQRYQSTPLQLRKSTSGVSFSSPDLL